MKQTLDPTVKSLANMALKLCELDVNGDMVVKIQIVALQGTVAALAKMVLKKEVEDGLEDI